MSNDSMCLANVPAGMYNYMLFIDGEKADGKKMVKPYRLLLKF